MQLRELETFREHALHRHSVHADALRVPRRLHGDQPAGHRDEASRPRNARAVGRLGLLVGLREWPEIAKPQPELHARGLRGQLRWPTSQTQTADCGGPEPPPCTYAWSPATNTVCAGVPFKQHGTRTNSPCDGSPNPERDATGTKPQTPGSWSAWSCGPWSPWSACSNGQKTRTASCTRSCQEGTCGGSCSGASSKTNTESEACATLALYDCWYMNPFDTREKSQRAYDCCSEPSQPTIQDCGLPTYMRCFRVPGHQCWQRGIQ